jgi:hypothetical protein
MASVKCFYLVETGELKRYLRRYADGPCPNNSGHYHNAMVDFDSVHHEPNTVIELDDKDGAPHNNDSRWPRKCACGYEFLDENYQVFVERVYERTDTGERMILRDAPPGAMYNAWWTFDGWKGKDGLSLVVKTPDGHDWMIDSQASNCTLKGDRTHKCWIRHGTIPNITVSKQVPGVNADTTCAAGGGSIVTPKFHGFLRNGEFVSC